MKLLQKTTRIYLLFSAILLLVAGIVLYMLISSFIEEEVTEKLYVNKERITEQLVRNQPVTQLPPVIEVEELPSQEPEALITRDTTLYDPITGEPESFRELTSIETINGKTYRVTLRQVILEPHDYYDSVGLAVVAVMALLLIGLLLITRRVSRKLWEPFYGNLEILKRFSLQKDQPIALQSSQITEFQELNQAIEKLTENVRIDYHTLEEFSENESHEMQTPLAIIQTKLDEALQWPNLSGEQAHQIKAAYSSAQRLSKLNQTLSLLTKIENRQFTATENIALAAAIEQQLQHFEEFIQARNLSVEKRLEAGSVIRGNPLLIETLLSNLLSNAIKHNVKEGKITIVLEDRSLAISNTGKPLSVPPERLFGRFTKADPSSESLGLGLAIIKKICETIGWKASYTANDVWHVLRLSF